MALEGPGAGALEGPGARALEGPGAGALEGPAARAFTSSLRRDDARAAVMLPLRCNQGAAEAGLYMGAGPPWRLHRSARSRSAAPWKAYSRRSGRRAGSPFEFEFEFEFPGGMGSVSMK